MSNKQTLSERTELLCGSKKEEQVRYLLLFFVCIAAHFVSFMSRGFVLILDFSTSCAGTARASVLYVF